MGARPSKPLKDAYHHREAYRHDKAADVFVPIALQLEKHGFTRYDYAQMFKHALALFNACAEGKLTVAGNLALLNVIWEPPQHSTTLTDDDLHSLEHASKQGAGSSNGLQRTCNLLPSSSSGLEFTSP